MRSPMLPEAIKKARLQRGMSQMDLVRKVENIYHVSLSSSMLSRYENPNTPLPNRISLPALFALTDYLKIDLNSIATQEMNNWTKNYINKN